MAHQPNLNNETQASNAKQHSAGERPKWKDRAKTWRTNLPSGDAWYQKLGSDEAIHDLCDRLTLRHVPLKEGLSFDQLFDQCVEQYATLEEDWKFFSEMVFSGACIVALHHNHPKDAIYDSLKKLLQHRECSEKHLKETLRRGALCGRLVDIVVMKKGSVAYKLPCFEGRGKGELSTRTLLRDCPEEVFPYLEDRIDREQADSESKQANQKTSRELHIARLVWQLLGRYSYEDVCKILVTRPPMPRGINYCFIPLPPEHMDRRQNAIDELLSQLRLREVGEGLVLYGLPEKCRALFDALEPYLMKKCGEWASGNGQVVKRGPPPLAYRLEPSGEAGARSSQTTVVIPLFNTQCEVVLVDLSVEAVAEHTITWKPDWVLHLDDGTGFKVRHGSVRFIYFLLDLEKEP